MIQSARSAVFVGFEALCRQNTLNPHALLKECGIDPIILRRQDLLVDYSRVGQVLNLAAQRSGNQQIGLQLSQQRDYLVFGPFGFLLSQAENLQDLIRITNQYAYLHAPGIRLIMEEKGEELMVSYQLSLANSVNPRQLIELGVGVVFRAAQAFFKEAWQPSCVTFAHTEPDETSVYKSVFQVPVLFGQTTHSIYSDKQILHAQPSEQRQLLKHHLLREYPIQDIAPPQDYAERTKQVLSSLLDTGEASLFKVANIIAVHPRQLQIHLQNSNTSFRELLNSVRFDKAQQQLTHSTVRITDLALSLGYADETAFSRAFKKWSGLSPRQWRLQRRAISEE